MRTWWIVRWMSGEVEAETVTSIWGVKYMTVRPAIGPFWTYREAMEMMHKWN